MADINVLDGSQISDDLLVELLHRLGDIAPGPYTDDAEAAANGVPINGFYKNGNTLYIRME